MKRIVLGSIALIALGMSAPAVAADMAVKAKAPPLPVVYDWSGAYVGFNIGGMWSEVTRTYPNLLGATFESKGEDVVYGFHAGAQGQWGNWVLGIEAAYSAGFRENQSTVVTDSDCRPSRRGTLRHTTRSPTCSRSARGSATPVDRWMIYGTGGYAVGSIKGQYSGRRLSGRAGLLRPELQQRLVRRRRPRIHGAQGRAGRRRLRRRVSARRSCARARFQRSPSPGTC